MYTHRSVATARAVVTSAVLVLLLLPRQAPAQQMDPAMEPRSGAPDATPDVPAPAGRLARRRGWARSFPWSPPGGPDNGEGGELRRTEWYLTQPALMANLESPSRRLVLRTTLNFEGVTLGSGELTYGGWGEGFIDKRHPQHAASRVHAQLEPLGDRRRTWGAGSATEWEASVSHARVTESHHGHEETTRLTNAAVRRSGLAEPGMLYGLAEASRSDPEASQGYTRASSRRRATTRPTTNPICGWNSARDSSMRGWGRPARTTSGRSERLAASRVPGSSRSVTTSVAGRGARKFDQPVARPEIQSRPLPNVILVREQHDLCRLPERLKRLQHGHLSVAVRSGQGIVEDERTPLALLREMTAKRET